MQVHAHVRKNSGGLAPVYRSRVLPKSAFEANRNCACRRPHFYDVLRIRNVCGNLQKNGKLDREEPDKNRWFLSRMLCPIYKMLMGNEVFATSMMSTIINLSAVIREKSEIEDCSSVVACLQIYLSFSGFSSWKWEKLEIIIFFKRLSIKGI